MNESDRDPLTGLFPIFPRKRSASAKAAAKTRRSVAREQEGPTNRVGDPLRARAVATGPIYWLRRRAREAAAYALRIGELVAPARCQSCRRAVPLEMHHDDYLKPLDVRFLCSKCHREADKLRRAAEDL